MEHEAWIVPLRLRHPFGISRGSVHELPTVLLRLRCGDQVGLGEAAPVRYLGHRADLLRADLTAICEALREPDPKDMSSHDPHPQLPEAAPAPVRAAVDIALWDLTARAAQRPLRAELDLRHPPAPATDATQTSYTVALDDLDAMAERAAAARHLPLLKIKLGRSPEFDREALRRVAAAAPRARLRVDANGGWSFAQARALLPVLADLGVEFVEQPLARGQLPALADLRRHSPLPLYADEDVQGPESLPALRGCVDGINIKLMKCGGISPALAMIATARREGWRVLLGCMIESRVGLAAAASLAGRVDELDLDAHMLTADDPVPPGSQHELSADLPTLPGPGLGIPPRW
ncbi:enolase C-terminal domain-like protein [Nannocystis sp.]|uniref:enolase C-terminal domain-like protein n=1 Tax=Nannocystis sp. TaxID=1962667 RepID=UPI0025F88AAC|nr:enolase C-terminal domain-like protein [Nannocystis sp.]MBK7830533.1 dipeptide epimerase [Nannocystis sp.]